MEQFPEQLTHGSGVPMTIDPTRLLLALSAPSSREDIAGRLGEVGLALEDEDEEEQRAPRPVEEVVNHTEDRFWARTRSGERVGREMLALVREMLGDELAWFGPVYRLTGSPGRGGMICPLPTVLLVRQARRLRDEKDQVGEFLGQLGMHEVPDKSRYLGEYRYFELEDPQGDTTAYDIQQRLRREGRELVADTRLEHMPMVLDYTVVPNDPLYGQQWGMTQIGAGGPGFTAWDITTGANGVVIAVLDSGCDLTHPDVQYSPQSINLGSMAAGTGGPVTGNAHGTACAGIVAASFNNALGVAGVAGGCVIMALARQNSSDVEVAAGINYAAANGARAVSMSFGRYAAGEGMSPTGWDFTIIDTAIADAVNVQGLILLAATGNENIGTMNRYPARHALVVACGASDQNDNRKSPASPDGEGWGGNFGEDVHLGVRTGVDVSAPGVLIPTTDIQGPGGYNTAAGTAGDYTLTFNGTSSATPHVAGVAALLFSEYPALTNAQARSIIERTAEKVGTIAYADDPDFPSGSRNQEMGYGRINALRALDLADAMIRDWPGDTGVEPSTPAGGNFWAFSDVVVRIFDDNVFQPEDPSKSNNAERGQTNFIYVRVTNSGPREARDVVVDTRITPFVGLQFVHPHDWTAVDAMHVVPTSVTASFPTLAAGASVIAKFTVSATQVETLWGWVSGMSWHPCLLASVTATNDYPFLTAGPTGGTAVLRRNNLAQRNLSIIDVLADELAVWPLLAGHRLNSQRTMEIVVDRRHLPPGARLLLALDDDGSAFPEVDLTPPRSRDEDRGLVFHERTRVETTFGCCKGILTLEKGSRFDCLPRRRLGEVTASGGVVVTEGGRRFVEVRDGIVVVRMEKEPHTLYSLALHARLPGGARGEPARVDASQRDAAGRVVGGASAFFTVA
jgi:subtilisin family serine protease